MMNSPCFDAKSKTDCPRRCAGCAKDCQEWDEYVRQRNAMYDERLRYSETGNDIREARGKMAIAAMKKKNKRPRHR